MTVSTNRSVTELKSVKRGKVFFFYILNSADGLSGPLRLFSVTKHMMTV